MRRQVRRRTRSSGSSVRGYSYPGGVPVRDSKVPHGPTVVFPVAGRAAFVAAVRTASPHPSRQKA
ncbi:DUF397 domain-containing protein [Streptomyces sp. NPDC057236]|uniref:DUF397 domain-containing protein n=1 Tax=Streptomyces sp. NPDC057236 TaxID=3346059 RepID=UPI0036262502